MASSNAALTGFRRLIRSARVVFQADKFAQVQAREQLKSEFRKHRMVSDPAELGQLLRGIDEVDEMLRFNIVQGKRNDRGNFEVKLGEAEHQATIESGQDDPHGIDIAPVDTSVLGSGVVVTKTKGSRSGGKCGNA